LVARDLFQVRWPVDGGALMVRKHLSETPRSGFARPVSDCIGLRPAARIGQRNQVQTPRPCRLAMIGEQKVNLEDAPARSARQRLRAQGPQTSRPGLT